MRFRKGKGGIGTSIVKHARPRGGHPILANRIPALRGAWCYSEDHHGVIFRLGREHFSEIQQLLRRAFGPPAQPPTETTVGGRLGWYTRKQIGVPLFFCYDRKRTEIIVTGPVRELNSVREPRARREKRSEAAVRRAIVRAESLLPGRPAPRGRDPRWQAIIRVGEFIEWQPEAVWDFAFRWGKHAQTDIRTAVATVLLEHLLEHHFELIFPRVRQAALNSVRFADTFERIWLFGKAEQPKNARRIKRLEGELRRRRSR